MVYKVAGMFFSFLYYWHLDTENWADVSLAAFGRKEIEIAEVGSV